MKTIRSGLLILLAGLFQVPESMATEPVQVVANSSVSESELPVATLRAIFSMRIRIWPDGQPIRVFVLPDRNDLHQVFSKEILHIYPYVLRDTWDRMTFTGTGTIPIVISNEEQLLELVAETPGAIGYGKREVPSHENIKILEIH